MGTLKIKKQVHKSRGSVKRIHGKVTGHVKLLTSEDAKQKKELNITF